MMKTVKWLVVMLGLLWAVNALALENPETVVKSTVSQLQQDINAQHASLKNSPEKLFALVKKVLLPKVDVNYMAGLTLGSLWRQADAQQKSAFVDEFGLLLTRAYANALLKVNNYKLTFKPVAAGWDKKTFASVSGTVQSESAAQPSNVTYYLVKAGSEWKIYDMVIEGVSFLQNYRSQFESFNDLESLIKKLKSLNEDAHSNHG